jgi:V/A-type H+/Na+-transporting ATPase subunit E
MTGSAASDTLAKVAAEFEAEVLASLEEGRGQALKTIDEAKKAAKEEGAKTVDAGSKQAASLERQIIGAAELEVRNARLRLVESAVSEVFESAMKEVSEGSQSKALEGLVREGIQVIGVKATVLCREKDRKAVAAIAKKLSGGGTKLTLSDKGLQATGGVILTTHDGSVRFDNTYEARLERLKPELRKEAATILTGE